jgi:hypothetical protein
MNGGSLLEKLRPAASVPASSLIDNGASCFHRNATRSDKLRCTALAIIIAVGLFLDHAVAGMILGPPSAACMHAHHAILAASVLIWQSRLLTPPAPHVAYLEPRPRLFVLQPKLSSTQARSASPWCPLTRDQTCMKRIFREPLHMQLFGP